MPIYDYRCDHCEHAFSAVQGFADEALTRCPSCGAVPRRLITAPAIVFKGSGWYKTDSRAAAKDEGVATAPAPAKAASAPAGEAPAADAPAGKTPAAPPKPAAGASSDGGGSGGASAA